MKKRFLHYACKRTNMPHGGGVEKRDGEFLHRLGVPMLECPPQLFFILFGKCFSGEESGDLGGFLSPSCKAKS